ncbi:MAG: UDP-N-acetylglucosamine 1-carboxyvinyltransferase [Candidatus Uhrbacteria bacterium]
MESLHITGGRPLSGSIEVSGAKNGASKMIIASMLTDEEVILKNVPRQRETGITEEIVTTVGATTAWEGDHVLRLKTPVVSTASVRALSEKNRISVLAIAPLLHRAGEAFVPLVGGDKIGQRPVNFHVDALQKMGANVEATADGYHATVNGRLHGALIEFPYPSVMATETALLAAVLADGRTVIRNAAGEPEIKGLIMMLQKMGAVIQINSGRNVEIIGVEKLHGCEATVMPDRIEAASYAAMALGTRGEIFVKGAEHEHLITFLNAVRKIGGDYRVQDDGIWFSGKGGLRGIELETGTHPGFMTDWQQPFLVALTQAEGTSVVHETVMEGRLGYTEALKKMGADVTLFSNCLGESPCRFKEQNYRHSAVVNGATTLKATDLEVPDIRAGLALAIAALVAEGTSVLTGIHHLDRGYERLVEKLRGVGAMIERKIS